ncbi:OmpA family protein [Shimia ponticola]|uniref:OmpA family protein n=1 Tax=Shimia ponticola TaxID=2582893 RepID=UPI00164BFF65|nr:OmpA family protein [Shimia ponticola]
MAFATGAASASDPCHAAAWERPAGCPRNDKVAALPAQVRQNNVFFSSGGSTLDTDAQQQLILLAAALATDAFLGSCIRLVGHADAIGDAAVNETIALERANAVKAYLREQGLGPAVTLETVSMGEIEPMAGFADDDALQRRVAIWARPCNVRN